jgi:hypothetical protein
MADLLNLIRSAGVDLANQYRNVKEFALVAHHCIPLCYTDWCRHVMTQGAKDFQAEEDHPGRQQGIF